MRHYIKIIALALPMTILAACGNNSSEVNGRENESTSEASVKDVTVQIVNPKERDFTGVINVVGSAAPNQVVMLHAMESGFVESVKKDIGDPVRSGELIAKLKNPELQRKFQKEKAMMEAKKSIYDRLQKIADKTPSLTTKDQVEMAKAEYESALAEYKATADRIAFLEVRSPFNGVITKRNVDKGALVTSGLSNSDAKPLFEVMEVETIRLRVPLPESDVSAVKVGTEAEVLFPELAGKAFQAKVSRISRALNPNSKTMQLEIDIPNPELEIKPGMYARVNIQLSSRENVLSVPHTTLVVYQDDFYIYTVDNGFVKRVPIRRGLENKEYFEILDANITPSSHVITRGKNLVEPGMKVEAIKKDEEK